MSYKFAIYFSKPANIIHCVHISKIEQNNTNVDNMQWASDHGQIKYICNLTGHTGKNTSIIQYHYKIEK